MFYDRFIELCARKGVPPSRAAVEAGLSKSTVTKWKNNPEAEPSGTAIKKLAEYFGVSKAALLGEKEAPAEEPADAALDEFTYALFHEARSLTEENRKKLLEMAEFFRQQQEKND